mgnify:FL=1
MESELFCEDYWVPKWFVSDPGDEVESITSDYHDETDEE